MLRNETNKGSDTYIQPMLARYSLEADDYKKKRYFEHQIPSQVENRRWLGIRLTFQRLSNTNSEFSGYFSVA